MGQQGRYHILVWMRGRQPANQLCLAFEKCRMTPIWAVSLPEAVSVADREFPHAIACTLGSEGPSLIDLETLVAHLMLGHAAVSIPPIPVWALTSRVAYFSEKINRLKLPIQLIPSDTGIEGLAAEVVHFLSRQGLGPELQPMKQKHVLYFGKEFRTGIYLSRYLGTCGIPTHSCEALSEALTTLNREEYQAIVVDLPRKVEGIAFLKMVAGKWPEMPVIALGDPDGWLSEMDPLDLPAGLVCSLPKPTRAEVLSVCLRRLLRLPATRAVSTSNNVFNRDEVSVRQSDILREHL